MKLTTIKAFRNNTAKAVSCSLPIDGGVSQEHPSRYAGIKSLEEHSFLSDGLVYPSLIFCLLTVRFCSEQPFSSIFDTRFLSILQNKLEDIFSLLHFLRIEPWSNYNW